MVIFSGRYFEAHDLPHCGEVAAEMEISGMADATTEAGRQISLGSISIVSEVFQVGI